MTPQERIDSDGRAALDRLKAIGRHADAQALSRCLHSLACSRAQNKVMHRENMELREKLTALKEG